MTMPVMRWEISEPELNSKHHGTWDYWPVKTQALK